MRSIYDGPATGKRSMLSQPTTWPRAGRSLDLPRSPGTVDAAADAGATVGADKRPPDSMHEQVRQATTTPPRDIPGRRDPSGAHRGPRPPGPNAGLFLRFLSSSTPNAPHHRPPDIGSPAPSSTSSGFSSQSEQMLLDHSPPRS